MTLLREQQKQLQQQQKLLDQLMAKQQVQQKHKFQPHNQQQRPYRNFGNQNMQNKVKACFNCQSTDHLFRNCPAKLQKKKDNQPAEENLPEKQVKENQDFP